MKAAETYLELNFIRGGGDAATQEAVFQIGASLKNEKRWVEALQVLETFADSFPRHAQAGQALTMIGQIHQTNQAWDDAIKAYRRVIDEYKDGPWVQEAKWSIAECRINLSQWREAMDAYRDYATAYPQDVKLAEANRRIDILRDLARFQELVNEKGQRKAFDAQFQIATIVRDATGQPGQGHYRVSQGGDQLAGLLRGGHRPARNRQFVPGPGRDGQGPRGLHGRGQGLSHQPPGRCIAVPGGQELRG